LSRRENVKDEGVGQCDQSNCDRSMHCHRQVIQAIIKIFELKLLPF